MAHATGAIKFKDGTIRYYEYNGTSDSVISHHYATKEEVTDNWRNGTKINCTCGKEESVSIYTDYGGGFYLDGVSCIDCNSVKPNDPDFDIIEIYETIHWAKELFNI